MERMNDMENKAKISVFGAGKMGTGIALQFAVTGCWPLMSGSSRPPPGSLRIT